MYVAAAGNVLREVWKGIFVDFVAFCSKVCMSCGRRLSVNFAASEFYLAHVSRHFFATPNFQCSDGV